MQNLHAVVASGSPAKAIVSQPKPSRLLVKRALAIEELAVSLNNIASDDKKRVDDYSDKELLDEAKYVLDLFVNPAQGHINGEALAGGEGPEQRVWARRQVAKLQRLIAKFDTSSASA